MSFGIVILISGNGSNLQAIIDAIQHNHWPISIKAVITNCPNAFGLERARRAHIKTEVIDHRLYQDRETFDSALANIIDGYAPELIVLAGFMRKLTPNFVAHFHNRIINIHPSLLPKYRGLHTYEKALANHDSEHGVSIHYVTESLDDGPIIAQKRFPILEDDTVATLKARTQALEHRLLPQVIFQLSKTIA